MEWRSGKTSVIDQVKENHLYHVYERGTLESKKNKVPQSSSRLFVDSSEKIKHLHVENIYDDFARQPLLPF